MAMGPTEHGPLTERAAGFTTASVADPFGHVPGVMHNPRPLEVQNRPSDS